MAIKREKTKETKFHHGLISIVAMAAIMLVAIVMFGAEPQIPLIFGCAVAGLVALWVGFSWDEILDGMLKGIFPSLEAILILLLIGVLVGVWIASGTVPTLIYYGLMVISAKYFLVATFAICTIVAFAIGSWGTVGTVGLAFMGIGLALGFDAPLIAGCVISGAYLGEVISPLSDATNLAAAVVSRSVFDIVRKMIPLGVIGFVVTAVIYTMIGLQNGGGDAAEVTASIQPLMESIATTFNITPVALLPLIIMIVCILIKLPAIPSMLIGSIAGMIIAIPLQGASLADLINIGFAGYVSNTGQELLDNLLTAGGLSSMLNTISIVIIAMAFGGLMQHTGQMQAFVAPMVNHIKRTGALKALTSVSCIFMNIILPDQYLGISVPGQMFGEEFKKRKISRVELGDCLLGGGAVTSPLIPWNTCGIYCSTILGVGAMAYMSSAYFCLLMPVITIIAGFVLKSHHDTEDDAAAEPVATAA